ncbi:MAG: DUF3301 domain-containing protein [Gammaproteobacteria bacterium]|nr:DUF3301 domain-containing protein [Gammaproteobacteria bacterium]MCW8841686.1 DUF3301 domain-containing protein [Gammaproteobacteria bacterium]MCW8927337.1 DUF3301 domain-containing protein [Gammaproteobacteria bacterium]MCW8957674.1 DUF3301 domain-containing protein [Gammaproteobacteria bacterium]MCW8971725.1 DUF3301 domain-containing protein [Gammaproteobacteria bacterium]
MEWLLVGLALAAWGWYSGTQAKEVAVRSARRACERNQQQLLDETVALSALRLRRDRSGQVRLLRRYDFEFSADGEGRHCGEIELLGRRVVATNLELNGFVLYEQEADES